MKKAIVISLCALFAFTSCGTYTGSGAYVGAQFGSILGSAIGGISDGWHGSNVGTVIGMAGGAVVGGMIGSAKDKANAQEVHDHYQQIQRQKAQNAGSVVYDDEEYVDDSSAFDPNEGGDDRLYDFNGSDYTSDYSASEPVEIEGVASNVEHINGFTINSNIDIRNARFVDDNRDNVLSSGELSKIIFEVMNVSDKTLFDIQPVVVETMGNKHIYISPNVHVESIAPGQGVRYTAMVKAGKLKNGTATFNISVLQGNNMISPVSEFTVQTRK